MNELDTFDGLGYELHQTFRPLTHTTCPIAVMTFAIQLMEAPSHYLYRYHRISLMIWRRVYFA